MLKKLVFLIVAVLSFTYLIGLTAGDIAILGVHTDTPKSMIFVALADIPAILKFLLPIMDGMLPPKALEQGKELLFGNILS